MCIRFNLFKAVRDRETQVETVMVRPEKTSNKNDFKEFALKNGKILGQVFEMVKDDWEHNWSPNKAALNKYAAAIISDIEFEKYRHEQAQAESMIVECQGCKTLYERKSSVCPVCLSRVQVRVFSVDDIPYLRLQPDCYRCSYYRNKAPKGSGVLGPACKYYGSIEDGLIEGEKSMKRPCEVCKCRECCQMESMFRESPVAYKQKYGNKELPVYKPGTYSPIWIDEDIPVLGK